MCILLCGGGGGHLRNAELVYSRTSEIHSGWGLFVEGHLPLYTSLIHFEYFHILLLLHLDFVSFTTIHFIGDKFVTLFP